MIWLISFVVYLNGASALEEDIFSSAQNMERLNEQVNELLTDLKKYQSELQSQIDLIDWYFQTSYQDMNSDNHAEEYVSNPVNTYRMIERLSTRYPEVMKKLRNDSAPLDKIQDTIVPIEELQKSADALIQLQSSYKLNTDKFAKGLIEFKGNQFQSDHHLDHRDVYNFALHSFHKQLIDPAYAFMSTAHHMKNSSDTIKYLKQIKSIRKIKTKKSKKSENTKDIIDYRNFEKLCRGHKTAKNVTVNPGKCKFLSTDDAYVRLGPFKMEILNESPFIVTFPDFMSDNEMKQYIKEASTNGLVKSTFAETEAGIDRSSYRTSKQAWLGDDVSSLSIRISLATQLRTDTQGFNAESYQVANYGIGGVYKPHNDGNWESEAEIKDFSQVFDNDSMLWAKFRRLATFMVYLSDVDAGGATVFPRLDLTVWPEKGKGVFWFNLDTNGSPDLQSLHGGCPVLKGSKWIANKWIKWQSHFDTSPCILKPYPEFKALKL